MLAGWNGVVRTQSGTAVAGAVIELSSGIVTVSVITRADGEYRFASIQPGRYKLTVQVHNRELSYTQSLDLPTSRAAEIVLSDQGAISLRVGPEPSSTGGATSPGESKNLSARSVSEIPLNKTRLQPVTSSRGRHHDGCERSN